MKNLCLVILVIISSITGVYAVGDTLLAHYPLVTDGLDLSGQNQEMTLENTQFLEGGIYSNGIYIGNDTTGSLIQTPNIIGFDFDDFTISLQFKLDSYPTGQMPIIIAGPSWRWLGAYLEDSHLAFMANDFSEYVVTDNVPPLDRWNTIQLSYSKQYKQVVMYLNGVLVTDIEIPILFNNDDGMLLNDHGGTGSTFEGYWRRLEIFNTAQILGVETNNELSNIEVIASNDQLSIQVPMSEKDVSMQFVDVSGKKFDSYELSSGANSLSISNIDSGVYMLVFTNRFGNTATKKIILAH